MEKNNNDNNKKTLILSIIGILVLVIAVVGVSFAMYSFSGTGTKENKITTGSISMSIGDNGEDDNYFELDSTYPMEDEEGVSQDDNQAPFTVEADDWGDSVMTINYNLYFKVVSQDKLTASDVKVALLDGDGKVIVGTPLNGSPLTAGVLMSSLTLKADTTDLYFATSGTITNEDLSDSYTVIAYVDENYELPLDKANSTTDNDGDLAIDQSDNSALHKKQTAAGTFVFKLWVEATQA